MTATEITGWRTAGASGDNGQGCVEIGYAPGLVGIRDSTRRDRTPILAVSPGTFGALCDFVRDDASES